MVIWLPSSAIVQDAASCASFVSRLNGKFEAAELVKKASEKYDYYSAKSISDWANYARKYPDQMQEADRKAFSLVSANNSDSCREYLKYFPSGAFAAEANYKLQQAIAMKQEQERIAEENRKKEEEKKMVWLNPEFWLS
ncbi:MAG: hypothetical protein IPH04_19250 [Saprospirales bacterium]|nr:hypothetical protein [Saprospirales bacterium]